MALKITRMWIAFGIAMCLFFPVQGQTPNDIDSLLEVIEGMPETAAKVDVLIQLSTAYSSHDLRAALQHAKDAVELAEKSGDKMVVAKSVNHFGKLGLQAGLMEIATENLTRYNALMQASGDRLEEAYSLNNLGAIRLTTEEFEKALELFKKSQTLLQDYYSERNEEIPAEVRLIFYGNIGGCLLEIGQFEKATEQFTEGIALGRSNPSYASQLAYLLANYGELLTRQNSFSEAESVLQEALMIFVKLDDHVNEAATLLLLGKLYVSQGNTEKALSVFNKGFALAMNQGQKVRISLLAEQISNLYKESGQADSALRYLNLAVEYEKMVKVAKANEELTRYELTKQIQEQRSQSHNLSNLLKKRTILFFAISIIIAIALIYIFLWIRKRHTKTREEMELVEQIVKELKESNATKDKLFSIISHDLRGSIGYSVPALELLASDTVDDEDLKKKLLYAAKESSKNTFSLLENLLNWARLQTNTIKTEPRVFRLEPAVQANMELIGLASSQKHITIKFEIDPSLEVFADRHAIDLVIRNLLSNAIKFTPENGRIAISARSIAENIEVTIADSGKGMEKQVLEKLFIPDNISSTRGTNGEKGTGLGLIFCKDFLERNEGSIRVESSPGEGSKFIFTVPAPKKT